MGLPKIMGLTVPLLPNKDQLCYCQSWQEAVPPVLSKGFPQLLPLETFLNDAWEYVLLQFKLIPCPPLSEHGEEVIPFSSEKALHVFKDFCPSYGVFFWLNSHQSFLRANLPEISSYSAL